MEKPSVAFAVPFYKVVDGSWWAQTADFLAKTAPEIDYRGLITMGTMATDHARNTIVDDFLKHTSAEWLFWIDSDNLIPAGALRRLLAMGKTLASGLYYGKNDPHPPIAYYRLPNGTYITIDKQTTWERGEILPVDAAGFGCILTHRSVYEDILKNYRLMQFSDSGIIAIHKDDFTGGPVNNHKTDGRVIGGQLRQRLIEPTIKNLSFPFFVMEHGKTEDIYFFDLCRRVGHKVWLDTSIEAGHLRDVAFTGGDYRSLYGH